ncbi:hypothetical protein M9Y10_034475 [Tritrichomonas musculus]|uniref:Uncharacterized protein n=1 Tax=Tritrichomonas musculus TaxID=1915356 RepID=A0ABR2KF28_9EUKA
MKVLKLSLDNEGSATHGVIRIPNPTYTIQVLIKVGTEFHSSSTKISTNCPDAQGKQPQVIEPSRPFSMLEDLIFDLPLTLPGVFYLQAIMDDKQAKPVPFIIDPIVNINGKEFPCSALSIQTNFSRCIGYVTDWLKNLKPISELGYKMIHLPPFQELGQQSQYSINDQLSVSKELFPEGFPAEKRWDTFKETISEIEKQLNIIIMSDVVLNHTSRLSDWLKEHPEAGYNVENSPHLAPALYVDQLLAQISNKITQWEVKEIPPNFTEDKLPVLASYLETELKKSDLWKYFCVDVDAAVDELRNAEKKGLDSKFFKMLRLRSVNFPSSQRLQMFRDQGIKGNKVDLNYAIALYSSPDMNNDKKLEEYRQALLTINGPEISHLSRIISEIVENVINHVKYNRFDPNGPRLGPITEKEPLVLPYFRPVETKTGTQYLACNGWIFNAPPTTDFTLPESEAYLTRQIIAWSDSIKLRFGKTPEDNPYLWDFMTKYVQSIASVVKGIRIDNAHSTPLHVAEYFIKKAREVNPHLYIMAELFTGSEEEDIDYINHLGINSIMREVIYHTEPEKITKLIWSSGGRPVAAVDSLDTFHVLSPLAQIPSVIYDITHDNECPSFDRLIVSSILSMSCSPVGTTRGYDDFLSFNPSVVTEYRKYPLNTEGTALQPARKILNELHSYMAEDGMDEIMSNYYDNIVSIFRCNSQNGDGVWLIANTREPESKKPIDALACPCPLSALVFEGRLGDHQKDESNSEEIKPAYCELQLNTSMKDLKSVTVSIDGRYVKFTNFPVGSVIIFKTRTASNLEPLDFEKLVNLFLSRMKGNTLNDLNNLLFKCEAEEQCVRQKGTYHFPQFGNCFYAGIAGPLLAFNTAKDMGSPLFQNLRDGNWLLDFITNRLFAINSLISIEGGIRNVSSTTLDNLPRFMMPKYVDRILRAIFEAAKRHCVSLMSEFVQKGDDFVHQLALASLEFYGPPALINNRLLPLFKNTLNYPNDSLAAGLPYFSTGYMRCWGRDTFIALRGIFLVPGRFDEARDHLIAFAACLRHGLIPNLLDGGGNCRYNSRDATWWFLQSLQDYVFLSGDNIFKAKVPQIYPTDDEYIYNTSYRNRPERPYRLMSDVVQDIMTRHANGIHFREWNAGKNIDEHMKDDGFNVDIFTDWSNGFILGGNPDNCGTWMDKLGTSKKAKNAGIPASPRDGAAIELIGLLQSTLRFLQACVENETYPHKGVKVMARNVKINGNSKSIKEKFVTWSDWSNLLISNFEGWFYIPTKPEYDYRYYIEQARVGVRGIYKDTVGASNEYGDYQFRPNLLVAMTVAPDLFDPYHAVRCLDVVESNLVGHIGMRTLDPSDWNYHPDYQNDLDNDDKYTAKGFNYHNGPEWLWLTGYFFRASMRFRRPFTNKMKKLMSNLKRAFKESPAFGLPELTNKDGAFCAGSCLTQAWSVSSVLDMLYDYSQFTFEEEIDWSQVDLPED